MEKDAPGPGAVGRLAYLDNLKVLLVVGVIAVHASITYGVDGSWYLDDYQSMAEVSRGLLTVFVGVGFLFGLGAFFLIAGRLSGPSLDRKGPRRFAADRLVRLGLPVLFYILLIAPVMEYVKARNEGTTHDSFPPFAWGQLSDPAPGPTWFLEALLVFSLAYAIYRALRPERPPGSREPLRGRQVVAVGVAIAILSFATHLVFQIGEEHFHIQFALFPQYAILFGIGCAAGRRGWLQTLTAELRRRCGIAGLIGIVALPVLLLAGGFADDANHHLFGGGWHWQAAGTSIVEAVLAASLPLFLIGWFREHWTRQGPLLREMASAAYGAFIIHPPVIVGLALALHGLAVPAELKFLVVLTGGVAGSFGLTLAAMRIPGVAAVVGSGPRQKPPEPSRPGLAPQPASP
jgi:glucan biosynthesis protein C